MVPQMVVVRPDHSQVLLVAGFPVLAESEQPAPGPSAGLIHRPNADDRMSLVVGSAPWIPRPRGHAPGELMHRMAGLLGMDIRPYIYM